MSPELKPEPRVIGYVVQARVEGDPIGGLFAVIEFHDADGRECVTFYPVPYNQFETDPRNPDFMKFKLSEYQRNFMKLHPAS